MMEVTWLLLFNMLGCFVTLLALILGQTKIVDAASLPGLALNGLGGLILALGATFGVTLEGNVELLPWVILNSTWTVISLVNLIRHISKRPKQLPSSATLPVSAFRSNPSNRPVCEHIDASWRSIARADGKWEWESSCHTCGIQTWHMKEGWRRIKDNEGNLMHVQQWHVKAMKDMTEEEKMEEKRF